MGKTKYSSEKQKEAITKTTSANDVAQFILSTLKSFNKDAASKIETFKTFKTSESDVTDLSKKDDSGAIIESKYIAYCGEEAGSIVGAIQAQKRDNENHIDTYRGALTSGTDKITEAVNEAKNYTTQIFTALRQLSVAINAFENTSYSLEEELDKLDVSDNVSVEHDEATGIDSVYYTYTDEDGNEQKLTVAEMVNAFYTYVGTTMNATVATKLANPEMSDSDFNSLLDGTVSNVTSNVDKYLKQGLFSIASAANIKNFYEEVTGKDYDKLADEFSESYSLIGTDGSNVKVEELAEQLGKETGSLLSATTAVLAGALGAYNLTDYMKKNELTPRTDATDTDSANKAIDGVASAQNYVSGAAANSNSGGYTSGSGGSPGGGTSGGGGSSSDPTKDKDKEPTKDKDKDPTKDKDKDPTKNAEPPVEVTKQEERGNLPEKVETDLGTKDYDELAREQFEAQGDAKIAENRAKITEEANKLFEAEDKTELINKLKEYGYTEIDINDIIQDRNLVTSALIEGDQRQQLATMANNLAKADGVKDFDTAYDEGQCCHGFYDGSSEALLSNASADPTVATAKTALTDATTKYTESVKTAQESITKVNEAQKTVETTKAEIVKNVASDTKNWSTTQQTKYSTELKTAQDAFIKKNGDATKWDATKVNEYQKIETNLKNKYVSEIQKDSSKWSNDQIEKYNKSVENYNTALKDANTKYEASQTAKTSYETSKANYEKARETYLKNVQNANKKDTYNSSVNTDTSLPSNGVKDPTTNTGSTSANTVGISDDQLLNGVNSNGNGASLG